jgi:16S rRNA (guanine527-N7)-methyltransferase
MILVRKYFPDLEGVQYEQFEKLPELYEFWNARINVISRKDIENLEVNHILHSLSIAKVISFVASTKICDLGTGGGFPGIPLAIMFPEVSFLLVDSIGKKIKVVQEITNSLDLKNVKAVHSRAENIDQKFDFIISRAVTSLPVVTSWVSDKIYPESKNTLNNGILYLKGGDFQYELDQIQYPHKVFNIQDFFEEDYFETKKIVYIDLSP